jgi:hypothetical protein
MVVRGGRLESTRDANAVRLWGGRTIPQITSLELSFDPSDDTPEATRHRKLKPEIEERLWRTVAEYLPNLVHLTVSHNLIAHSAPKVVSQFCPNLDSLTWRNQDASPFLFWLDLDTVRLRSVDMDGTAFYQFSFSRAGITDLFNDDDDDERGRGASRCIFHRSVDQLERVSLRNATYYGYGDRVANAKRIPQRGLIKFVRRATNLRWFRSDLTPENKAMLRRERPDVTFVS